MTIGTRVDSTLGPVASNNGNGLTVERNASNAGFMPFKVDSVPAITGSSTMTLANAGVNTMSGTSALTLVLPLASDCPGAEFMFRSLSAHAHIITASQETAGVRNLYNVTASTNGSRATLPAVVGASIYLKSDGNTFFILAASGSLTIA